MSIEAKKLIEQALQNHAKFLDLSYCRLEELPKELTTLIQLEELTLNGNKKLNDLSQLVHLQNLTWLSVSNTQVSDLSPLGRLQNLSTLYVSNTEVSDLGPLSQLEKLTELYVSNTAVSDLTPIVRLPLTTLDASFIQLSDLRPLAHLNNLTTLDVSNEGDLSDAPWLLKGSLGYKNQVRNLNPLAKLHNLTWLSISNTAVSDLSSLGQLHNLATLYVYNTRVSDLSPLAQLHNLTFLYIYSTRVSDLSPLAQLYNLTTLEVFNTKVNDLSPLAQLHKLTSLEVHNTQVSDLSPLAQLHNLITISVYRTQVSDLRPLAQLQNLVWLFVNNTQVNDLSPLTKLHNLTWLNISNTLVSDLMPLETIIRKKVGIKWKDYDGVKGIYVLNCPLENPPREIVKQGVRATLRYIEEVSRLKQENKEIYIKVREAKVLLVGQGKSGKTTLRKKLENPAAEMPAPGDTTRGIEITRLNEKMPHTGEDLRLNLWDFGGQDIQHYAHQFFLTGSSLYALITNERIQDSVHLPYWLNIVEMLGKKSPVILIQNKDGGHCQPLKDEAAIRARFGNVHNRVYQSDFSQAETEREFAALRQTIVEQASKLPHVEREYLRSFNELREKLEAEAQSEKHYLRWEAYLALMPELGEDLLRDYANALTFLGVCQYFPEDALLADYVFLRPKWLIDALFELLLHPSMEVTRGHFSEKDTRKIWVRPEYQGMHGLLVRMMKEFELCYRVEGEGENYIIPQRLPGENKSYGWDTSGNVPVQYRYKFMPKGVLTRLICRLYTRIEEDVELGQRVWNDAVIFTLPDGKCRVFAREVYSENTIELRATGPKHAEMLNEVIRKMDDINRDAKYENLQVEKMVPCPCGECALAEFPGFHEYDALLKRIEKGKSTSECKKSGDDVLIDEIFGRSGVTKPRLKSKGAHHFDGRLRHDGVEDEPNPRRIFISYSKADQQHKDRLLVHLASLRGKALTWHDQDILPGEDWDGSIRDAIAEADVVLYLVSAHSLAAEYIQKVELPLIEEREDCILVPVIVDFCNWQEYDFAQRNALPGKGVEVVNKVWTNEDEAWLEVVRGVKRVIG